MKSAPHRISLILQTRSGSWGHPLSIAEADLLAEALTEELSIETETYVEGSETITITNTDRPAVIRRDTEPLHSRTFTRYVTKWTETP